MMGIRGLTAANEAGLPGDELAMVLVADAPGFAERQLAFVDAAAEAVAATSATIGVVVVAGDGPGRPGVQPRTRGRDTGRHFGGGHRGRFSCGVAW